MYLLKETAEDFIVEEHLGTAFQKEGPFACFLLQKKQMTTQDAILQIARFLQIPAKEIGYCGNKDKHAKTSQHISIRRRLRPRLEQKHFARFSVRFIGYLAEQLSLGSHQANRFCITVRNLEPVQEMHAVSSLPNYFGEQRFSTGNAQVGKLLAKKDYQQAAALLAKTEQQILASLLQEPHNPVKALQSIPLHQLMLYVHAYQSLLFNRMLTDALRHAGECKTVHTSFGELAFPLEEGKPFRLALIGFDSDSSENTLRNLMKQEQISPRNFINRQFPCLTCEEQMRDALVPLQNLKIEVPEPDEQHAGKRKQTVEFTLQKGSFATIAIRTLLL